MVAASTRNESIVLNKSITVRASGLVTLRPGNFRGIDIQCNSCGVVGFTLENFEQAAGTNTSTARSNVVLRDLKFRNVGAGIWVYGTNWTVERVTINPFRCRSGEDYINAFGTGHTFRRLFFAGLLPSDLRRPDGTYKHNDCIQTWTAGGAIGLKNTLIEECIFTDFAQGTYLHNETGIMNGVNGITVRNNVFWGSPFPRPGGSIPSHGTRYTGPQSGPMVLNNNLYRNIASNLSLEHMSAVTVQGNIVVDSGGVYALEGTSSSAVNRGTVGNILWHNNWTGNISGPPDKTNINPQLQNPNAVGAAVIGPDGIPWTDDDAWRPMNPAAVTYGPQLTLNQIPPGEDVDQDLLLDIFETDTGTFVSEEDTGSDPTDPDSDDDGVMDGIEITLQTDPNNPNDFPILALNTALQVLGIALLGLAAVRYSHLWPKSRL